MYTEKGERTRQHFIEVSADLFNKKGYAGTAISEILDAAGYSKGALYRTFVDKDELSLEAFKYNLGKLQRGLIQNVHSKKSAISKLLAIPDFYINNRVEQIIPGGCPILNTAIEVDDTNPHMNEVVKQAFSSWKNLIIEIVDMGKSNNEFNQELNAEELAFYIVATIEGSITLAKTFKQNYILNNNMKRLKKNIQESV
jgi:TetR/AcrR family transcriptional repressor of nem operon